MVQIRHIKRAEPVGTETVVRTFPATYGNLKRPPFKLACFPETVCITMKLLYVQLSASHVSDNIFGKRFLDEHGDPLCQVVQETRPFALAYVVGACIFILFWMQCTFDPHLVVHR